MFFIKRSELVLDCFTDSKTVHEFARPALASKFIPEWWKSMPNFISPEIIKDNFSLYKSPTIKHCAGFIDYYTTGIIFPLWSDLAVSLGKKGTKDCQAKFADAGANRISPHNLAQLNYVLKETEIQHFKLIAPWQLKCKEDVKWVWLEPTWNKPMNRDYMVFTGITEFKYQHQVNINMLFYRDSVDRIIDINFGEPLVHLMPLTDKKIVLKHHLVTTEEMMKLGYLSSRISFHGAYRRIKEMAKARENKNK